MTNEERQQAIEWLKRRPVMMAGAKRMYDLAVEALEAYVPDMNDGNTEPSCENDAEITRCSHDTISRQAAIYIASGYCHPANIAKELAKLPSAQPDRPKGHWRLDFAQNKMTCSECGRTFKGGFDLDNADNFCRHCGSDNRGERWIRMK